MGFLTHSFFPRGKFYFILPYVILPHIMACGFSPTRGVTQSPIVEAQNLNHWITREAHSANILDACHLSHTSPGAECRLMTKTIGFPSRNRHGGVKENSHFFEAL